MYKDKNTTFNTEGNEDLDKLLVILDSINILSKSYETKIRNLILWILTNHENYISDIKESIESLVNEMKWMEIFSESFIEKINKLLTNGLEYQILSESIDKYNL